MTEERARRRCLACPLCHEVAVIERYDDADDSFGMECGSCGWRRDGYITPADLFMDYEDACRESGTDAGYAEADVGTVGFTLFGEDYTERPLFGDTRCQCGTDVRPVVKVQECYGTEFNKTRGGCFAGFVAVCPVCSRRARGYNYMALERRWSRHDYDWDPSEDIEVMGIDYEDDSEE